MTESRFVIIDGVQISRLRAEKLGLLKSKKPKGGQDGPPNSRARTSGSARKGGQGGVKPDAAADAADDEADDVDPDDVDAAAVVAAGAADDADNDVPQADPDAKSAAQLAPKKK